MTGEAGGPRAEVDDGRDKRVYLAAAGEDRYFIFAAMEGEGVWAPLAMADQGEARHFSTHLLLPEPVGDGLELFLAWDRDGDGWDGGMDGRPVHEFDGFCSWAGARLALFELGDCTLRESLKATRETLERAALEAQAIHPVWNAGGEGYMLGGRDTILTMDGGRPVYWINEEASLRWLEEYGPKGSLVEAEMKKLRPHRESDFAQAYVHSYLASEGLGLDDATLLSWAYGDNGQRMTVLRTGDRTWADNFGPAAGLQ